MAFAGVKPGMVVADIFSAGGYYTELLAGVVGPHGKVLAINNVPYANFAKDDIKARFTEGRLKNVERRLVEASYMNIAPEERRSRRHRHGLPRRLLDRREGRLAGDQHRRLPRVRQAHAQAGRQTTDRRSQRRRGHRQGNRRQAASTQRGLGEARAWSRMASCSRRPTTACAIRTTSSTRWSTTRRSRERPTATCISTA